MDDKPRKRPAGSRHDDSLPDRKMLEALHQPALSVSKVDAIGCAAGISPTTPPLESRMTWSGA